MTAADAARLLDVSRATLYAYVSRGFVRSQASPGSTRERLYARSDVERLRRRSEERRAPDKAAARALEWGMPVLESSISCIDGHRLYYRGLIWERRGHALARQGAPGAHVAAYEWIHQAMEAYEQAERVRPPGNDDSLLRWNHCLRLCERFQLGPEPEEPFPPVLGDD